MHDAIRWFKCKLKPPKNWEPFDMQMANWSYIQKSNIGLVECPTLGYAYGLILDEISKSQCFLSHHKPSCLHVCGSKRSSCHADPYTVSRCCTRGESEDHTSERKHTRSTLALKTRTDITRVQNRCISGPTKRTDVLQKLFLKQEFLSELCRAWSDYVI